ncbi:ileal sodium/bile acid cotransporter-like [Dermacentor silvarum]|uniref:ileal sodium/bile acid cotransporter-like n=1 Tax=Dermacentor silvarum TaxID=543639 RepID=UPI00189980C3|nr:ileal sodium/bile acid cotransporter-like [Dermacentor silvarum]
MSLDSASSLESNATAGLVVFPTFADLESVRDVQEQAYEVHDVADDVQAQVEVGASNKTSLALGPYAVTFDPPRRISVYEKHEVVVQVSFAMPGDRLITVSSADTGVATVDVSKVYLHSETNGNGFNVTVRGVFVSYTKLYFKICELQGDVENHCIELSYVVAVLRMRTVLQKGFPVVVGFLLFLNYINMGCQVDMAAILECLKQPLAPIIGCLCQFIFMPLASYCIGLLILDDPLQWFGIFLLGCSPGGSASNLWTLVFNGDLNLSITMTFISTIASVFMMPLWVFVLGNQMSKDETQAMSIPYVNLIASLAILAVPLAIGLLIQQLRPRLALTLQEFCKPLTIFVLVSLLILTATVQRYIFQLITWQAVVCGALISWSAYIAGTLSALAGGLNRAQIIALAIEVAFQNSGVAIVIMYTSLPRPDSDLVIVPVVYQSILQGVPLYVILVAYRIRAACVSSERAYVSEKALTGAITSKPEMVTATRSEVEGANDA